MAFSQSSITDVQVALDDCDLAVTWTSSALPQALFQVYVDRRLAWYGTVRRCRVPRQASVLGRSIWVEVGTVTPGEETTDFSGSLTGLGSVSDRARLDWLGGTYLDSTGLDDIRGFRIYSSGPNGQQVNYGNVLGDVAAYPGAWISDGFGLNGFGQGGFGRAANTYRWLSAPLASGSWQFAVVPYDHAGNSRGTGQTVSVSITTAPLPPAPGSNGSTLDLTYLGPSLRQATLSWQPIPSS